MAPRTYSRTKNCSARRTAVRQLLSDVLRHSSGRRSLQCELSSRTLCEAVQLVRASPPEPPADGHVACKSYETINCPPYYLGSPRHRSLSLQRAPMVLYFALRRPSGEAGTLQILYAGGYPGRLCAYRVLPRLRGSIRCLDIEQLVLTRPVVIAALGVPALAG
jgi:hypothetical protein